MADVALIKTQERMTGARLTRASGWWGMLFAIATEAAIFAYLLFSYYYLAIEVHRVWPTNPPSVSLALANTIILLASSVSFWWSDRQFISSRRSAALGGLALTGILGLIFLGIQLHEWKNKSFSISSDPYGSLYFTITGFHMAHVIAGLLMIAALYAWVAADLLSDYRKVALSIGALYWHFVDAVWLTVFFTFYVTPYLS